MMDPRRIAYVCKDVRKPRTSGPVVNDTFKPRQQQKNAAEIRSVFHMIL